jgi:endonuclease YncB( thermonuclease family)
VASVRRLDATEDEAPMTLPYVYRFNATLVSVHDGDTISVVIDQGLRDYKGRVESPIPIRLVGMAARELADPGGPEARDYLISILPAGLPLGLSTVKPDKYNPRLDAFVETPTLPDLATHLIRVGWAVPWDGRGAQPKPAWPRVPLA